MLSYVYITTDKTENQEKKKATGIEIHLCRYIEEREMQGGRALCQLSMSLPYITTTVIIDNFKRVTLMFKYFLQHRFWVALFCAIEIEVKSSVSKLIILYFL